MKMLTQGLTKTALASALLLPVVLPTTGRADDRNQNNVQHVLLISIDGFHAVDLEVCVAAGTCRNLASLTQTGVTYTNASTTKPSDSFPGLLPQLTGGTPKSTGVFYDDSYDRTLFAPGSNCTTGPGTESNIAEPIDYNLHSIDGGVNASLTGLNSAVAINPNNLPGSTANGGCRPVWPHNLVRTNTIFGVLHARGLRTAWADKHPAYDLINGNAPSTGCGQKVMFN
jgi:Type I phosphodiesterase / nucleotide pyrophosphatase